MATGELSALCRHVNAKIAFVKRLLQWRAAGREELIGCLGPEMAAVRCLMAAMEEEVRRRRRLVAGLEALRKRVANGKLEAELLLAAMAAQGSCGLRPEPAFVKKATKDGGFVKEPALITADELHQVPGYMKGRLTLAQINATLQTLHAAAASKYKILHHNPKSLPTSARFLYHRFREEETKETKGAIFVVEADLKEFTQLKVDRRFHAILNVLRHCQRVREVRGARLVRYVLC